jgi:hypothetical protein
MVAKTMSEREGQRAYEQAMQALAARLQGELVLLGDCFNYLNLSQVASAASGSPPSLWMKLAHLAYLTFAH